MTVPVVVLSLAAMAGCAATGSLFREIEPGPGKAMIYVYRGREVAEAGLRYEVTVDGEYLNGVKGVRQLGYLYREVDPGRRVVVATTNRGSYALALDAESGKPYYVEVAQLSPELGTRVILRSP